jgi:putative ABC transport system permease protein
MTAPVIELRGLARTYPGPPPVHALRPADLVIEAGDYVAVTGPSGSGKSTLLHLLGLLDSPTAGSYLLGGLDTPALGDRDRSALRGRRIGVVFQAFHLLAYRTALENVLLAELYNQTPRSARLQAAVDALGAVGLGHRLDALPTTLSGGSASGSRSRGRWSTGRAWCCATSRRETWTRATPPRSWNCSTSSTRTASRSWSSRTTRQWRPTRAGPWRSVTGSCPSGPGPVMPSPGTGLPLPRLTVRDAAAEAVAGIVQRPGRAGLTMLGTVLGVGAFVAVLGLTATGAGQISRQFTVLEDTTVTVADNGPANNVAPPGTNPAIGFPAGADAIADHINGVVAAGVWWPVTLPEGTNFSASLALSGTASQTVNLLAASPGAVRAMVPAMVAGSPLSAYENDTAQHVAMIDTSTASALGISPARLPSHPAVFVNGIAYTVVGVYSSAQRVASGGSAMLIPENTALEDYGNPQPGIGTQEEAQMIVATRTGAAQAVARQIAAAELPTDPHRLVVTPPQNPLKLQGEVNGDLAGLFLILALISLLIGAVGIANTTLVAVLERTGEIGVRRAVGARPRHIAAQFLAESTALGTLGGLIGTCIGVGIVVIFAAIQNWTAVLNPAYTLPAPLIGSLVGLLAGAYPALRAARTSPLAALRHA